HRRRRGAHPVPGHRRRRARRRALRVPERRAPRDPRGRPAVKRLYTIGYEGMELHSFIGTLKAYEIDVLLDVRDFPSSRKRGFSKSPLREALEAEGIEYRHEKALGTPKPIRDKVKRDGDTGAF